MTFMIPDRQFEFGSLIREKKQLEELKPSIYVNVPGIIEKRYPKHTGIKHYICAGAVCSEEMEKMIRNTMKSIPNCYGSSDVAGVVISASEGPANKLFPIDNCGFDLCDDGAWISTDTLIEGYFGQEELTKKSCAMGAFWG